MQAEAETPVGARVAERASARASVRVDSREHFRPALGQPPLRRAVVSDSSWCLLCTSEPVAFGPTEVEESLFDTSGFPVLFVGSYIVGFVFASHYLVFFKKKKKDFFFFFSLSFFPPGLCRTHSVPVLGLKWLAQGKSWSVSGVFSERQGPEQPCSLFVLFDFANLCSLKQNSQTGSILDQWPARIWPFVREMITAFFCLSRHMQMRARALKSKECKQEMCARWKLVNWVLSLFKSENWEVSLGPLAGISDTVYRKMKGTVPIFPLMAEFTLRL